MKLGRTAISAMPKLSGSASAGAASVVLVKAVVAAHAEQPSDRGSRIDPNLNRTRRSQGACYASIRPAGGRLAGSIIKPTGENMGLSWQQGPLSMGAMGRFLVPEPLPKRLLYVERLRRRMRVRFGG